MKNILKFSFLFFALAIVLSSCGKDDDDTTADLNNPNTNASGIQLVSPTNNQIHTSTGGDAEISFNWSNVEAPTGYVLQLSLTEDFSIPFNFNLSQSGGDINLTQNDTTPDTYYWRVRAENSTEWSATFIFVID